MSWQVLWAPRALKELARLDRDDQHRVRQAEEAFGTESKGDVLRLQDIFRLDHDRSIMQILHVLRRDEAY